MAAPADTPRVSDARRAARRAEKAPSGGWRTIAGKELADHLESIRFVVLLIVIGIAAIVPMYFISTDISAAAPQVAGQPALFLVLFIGGSDQVGGVPMIALAALLVPLVGIAFGFDGINSERAQGTLSRLLAQPIHRDDVINGKFVAGIAVIALMLTALVGFGTWFGLTLFGQFLLPLIANFLFPATTTTLGPYAYASTQSASLFLRISPAVLYDDIVRAVMNPSTTSVLGFGNIGQAISNAERVQTSLLTLDQSILLVWPQIVVLTALTTAMFALAYVLFLRQEVRA